MEEKIDFRDIVKKIDLELEFCEKEIKNIDVSIKQDLQLLIDEYSKHESLNGEKFKQEYFDILKRKKLAALSRAIDRLQSLKEDILIAMA